MGWQSFGLQGYGFVFFVFQANPKTLKTAGAPLTRGVCAQALLQVVECSVGPGGGATEAGSPAKIALFSLGNMCAYAQCAAELQSLGIWDALASLAPVRVDATIDKYCIRIQVRKPQSARHSLHD